MNISVFGLGYAGCVGAACYAWLGHHVTGVDVDEQKIALINQGRAPIVEAEIDALVKEGRAAGRLEAVQDPEYAVLRSELSILSVGTPGDGEGRLKMDDVYAAARQIGQALRKKEKFHVVAIRSTVLPGASREVGRILEETSGRRRNVDFAVAVNPEFLREGTAVRDFMDPPFTLIGCDHPAAEEQLRALYKGLPAEIVVTDPPVAELMKYVNNTYHALKVVFSNEVGNLCKGLDIDSHKVMELFCRDRKLNLSPYYFKPGFAYGGSCLPKDTQALVTLARDLGVEVPVLSAISRSNEVQKQNAVKLIASQGKRRIGILGLSFKAGTGDLRHSPMAEVAEALLDRGFELRIYDRNVKESQERGLFQESLPRLYELVDDDLDRVASGAQVLVVANREPELAGLPARYPHKILVDLVRAWDRVEYEGRYEGLSWGNVNRLPERRDEKKSEGQGKGR